MATPWYIKVRADLETDPRVIRMAGIISAQGRLPLDGVTTLVTTNIVRDVTLAGLLRVWRHANGHTCDGLFRHVTSLDYIDTIAGIAGFGEAMQIVGWVELDATAQTLTLPNFLEWNTPAKSGARGGRPGNPKSAAAQRQQKYRAKQQAEQPHNNPVTTKEQKASQPHIGRGKGTVQEEREYGAAGGNAAVLDAIGTKAEVIALAYPRQDDPIGCMSIIADDLLAGQDAEQMRLAVQRCANFIRKAPGGSGNRYVPSARAFFAERQWRSPEAFESRWQAEGHESAPPARKPVKLTTAPKNGF